MSRSFEGHILFDQMTLKFQKNRYIYKLILTIPGVRRRGHVSLHFSRGATTMWVGDTTIWGWGYNHVGVEVGHNMWGWRGTTMFLSPLFEYQLCNYH